MLAGTVKAFGERLSQSLDIARISGFNELVDKDAQFIRRQLMNLVELLCVAQNLRLLARRQAVDLVHDLGRCHGETV